MIAWLIKNKFWISLIVVVAIVSIFLYQVSSLGAEGIINFTPESWLLAALVFFLLYALKSVSLFFPIATLYIAAGIVFPTFWAVIVTYSGWMIKMFLGYSIGKKLGEEKFMQMVSKRKRVAGFLNDRRDNLTSLCFAARILNLPNNICNVFFGAVKMPYGRYVFASLLGMSPIMIPLVIAGSQIANPLSLEFLLPFGISLSVVLGAFLIFRRRGKGKNKEGVRDEKLD